MTLAKWADIPEQVREHLEARLREREISKPELYKLQFWVTARPSVPDGPWFKDFGTFVLVGDGEFPKTFLRPGQAPYGTRL